MATPGRNDPCPCGSGRKYKKCCLETDADGRADVRRVFDLRESAIARLLDYASSPQFDEAHDRAWDLFWANLDEEQDGEHDDLMSDPESESKFHAFFTLDFELESGESLIERFLAAKRAKVDPRECEYLERLAEARLRLFEVLKVDPAVGVHLADLESGDGLTVSDSGSDLVRWDVIAARVTTDERGVSTFETGLYVYPADALDEIRRVLDVTRREFLAASPEREASFSRFRALVFHQLWLDLVVFDESREMLTHEGDHAEPYRVVFEIRDERAVRTALSARDDMERAAETFRWIDRHGADPIQLGTLRFESGTVVLDVFSRSRADRGRGWLEAVAGDAVAYRELRSESMIDAIRRLAQDEQADGGGLAAQTTGMQAFAERSHRTWLDTPSPALESRTPREASRLTSLRPRVVELLKEFENQVERDRHSGLEIPPLDWMWSELGLSRPEPERQRTLFK